MFRGKRIENAALWLVTFGMAGGLSILFLSGTDFNYVEGNPFAEVILAALYLIVVVITIVHLRSMRDATLGTPVLLALILLAWVSASWAQTPGLVLRRSIALTGTSLLGVALAARFTFAAQLRLLRRIFRFAAVLSFLCALFVPQYGKGIDGTWQGIFGQKNSLGGIMALAVLVEWYLPAMTFKSRVSKFVWLSTYAILLGLSNSITAFISVSITLVVIAVFRTLRWRYRVPLPILLAVGVLLGGALLPVLITNMDSVMPLLGRSGDLTGRTELWSSLVSVILKQLFLGYGYSGFWEGASVESEIIYKHIGWKAMYSHNGYLEMVLSLGLCGLLLILLFVGTGIKRALVVAENRESIQDLWPLAFLVFFLIHNLAECTMMWQNKLEWALCISTVIGSDRRVQLALAEGPDQVNLVSTPVEEYA
jgi:exopolysaccharide production protein ExoQ